MLQTTMCTRVQSICATSSAIKMPCRCSDVWFLSQPEFGPKVAEAEKGVRPVDNLTNVTLNMCLQRIEVVRARGTQEGIWACTCTCRCQHHPACTYLYLRWNLRSWTLVRLHRPPSVSHPHLLFRRYRAPSKTHHSRLHTAAAIAVQCNRLNSLQYIQIAISSPRLHANQPAAGPARCALH